MEEDDNEHTKLDYYLAQIALEVRRSVSKRPKRYKLHDLLIKFKPRGPVAAPMKAMNEEEKKKHIANSKAAWLGAVGFGKAKRPKKKK